jgi:hypothetical protein
VLTCQIDFSGYMIGLGMGRGGMSAELSVTTTPAMA